MSLINILLHNCIRLISVLFVVSSICHNIGRFAFELRFWLCREAFTNVNTIEDYDKESSNLQIYPHLFKCPNGYHFDIKRRFCRRENIASCGAQATTTTTTTTERAEQRDIGLFGLLFGLP